jgi:hypothetical protein
VNYAVGEPLLVWVVAEVDERKDDQRRFAWKVAQFGGQCGRRWSLCDYAIGRNWLSDVLDLLLTHWLETEGEFLLDLTVHLARHPDAARFRELLESRCDVDAFAVAILSLHNDLAQIDADPDLDARIVGQRSVAFGKTTLQGHGAFHSVHYTAKFGQETVTHQLEDTPTALFNLRLEQFFLFGTNTLERGRLVAFHHGGIANDIGGENGGKLAFHKIWSWPDKIIDERGCSEKKRRA